jgi:hypothetical protein
MHYVCAELEVEDDQQFRHFVRMNAVEMQHT